MMKNQMLSHKLFQALVFAAMAVPLLLDGIAPASASLAQAGSVGAKPVAASEMNVQPLLANITTIAADVAHDLAVSISGVSSNQNVELAPRHRQKPKKTLTLSSNSTTLINGEGLSIQVAGRTKEPHKRRHL